MLCSTGLAGVRQELRANEQRFVLYIQGLRKILLEIFDDHTGAFCDWDWQWPQHEPLVLSLEVWERARHERGVACTSIVRDMSDLYTTLNAMPPAMDSWVDAWDGNAVSFLAFLFSRLQDVEQTVLERIDACVAALDTANA